RRRHTRFSRDWSSDVCSSDLGRRLQGGGLVVALGTVGFGGGDQQCRILPGRRRPRTGGGGRGCLHLGGQSLGGRVVVGGHRLAEIGRSACRETGRGEGGGASS